MQCYSQHLCSFFLFEVIYQYKFFLHVFLFLVKICSSAAFYTGNEDFIVVRAYAVL